MIRGLAALAALTGTALLGAGCVSSAGAPTDLGQEVRPEAPPEYDVLVAQQHASEGRIQEAIAAYRRAVVKDAESAYLHRLMADALARVSELDEAVVHAERAYALEPEDALGRSLLVQLYRVKRAPESAARLLTDDAGAPRDIEAAAMLYQVYLEAERYDEALSVARWMMERSDDPLRAHLAMANVYRKKGDREGEIAVYQRVLDENPDHHRALLLMANAQMAEDDLEGAIATLEEVERRFPDDHESVGRLGFLFYEARRFSESADRFERALSATPTDHQIAFFLGVARRRDGREDAALEVFASIPGTHKHYAEARTQMAAIFEKRGDFEAARTEVSRAMGLEPTRPLQLYSAQLLSKSGDFEGAIAFLKALLENAPDDDELVYNLGVVYGEVDRTEDAIRYMERALALNPDNASALNYIGYTWAERGENLDEAERMIMRAIELRPGDGYIVDSLAWVYYMRARPLVESGQPDRAKSHIDRAIAELERAAELTGGDPVISEHLGDAYLLLDQRERALELFREAVELGPRLNEQPNLQEKLESLQRELE